MYKSSGNPPDTVASRSCNVLLHMLYLHTYVYVHNYNTKAILILNIELIILHIYVLATYECYFYIYN